MGYFAISTASQANIAFSCKYDGSFNVLGRTACTRYGTSIWCISMFVWKQCISFTSLGLYTVYDKITVATSIPPLILDHWQPCRERKTSEDEDYLLRQPHFPTPTSKTDPESILWMEIYWLGVCIIRFIVQAGRHQNHYFWKICHASNWLMLLEWIWEGTEVQDNQVRPHHNHTSPQNLMKTGAEDHSKLPTGRRSKEGLLLHR